MTYSIYIQVVICQNLKINLIEYDRKIILIS